MGDNQSFSDWLSGTLKTVVGGYVDVQKAQSQVDIAKAQAMYSNPYGVGSMFAPGTVPQAFSTPGNNQIIVMGGLVLAGLLIWKLID